MNSHTHVSACASLLYMRACIHAFMDMFRFSYIDVCGHAWMLPLGKPVRWPTGTVLELCLFLFRLFLSSFLPSKSVVRLARDFESLSACQKELLTHARHYMLDPTFTGQAQSAQHCCVCRV